ncbi:MAG TPA: hypothetical protein VNZ52_16130, partial [Candidatus Thermoplasmatota archaeon]|nr:hypothetical protein [Candidatus Thermoplasmatota archaeon]
GAGGAGFPTYVKYQNPPRTLLVNGAESEPGYYTDKLLFQEHPCEYALLFRFLRDTFGFEEILVAVEEMAAPWMTDMDLLAARSGDFEVRYIPNRYALGQERALTQEITGIKVGPRDRPQSAGVVVNNNETLYNLYRALFEGHPVTTKMVVVFGETPRHAALEVPIGTYARDLVALAGLPEPDPDHVLYDGGPVLNVEVPEWRTEPYGIRRTTNGLLVASRTRGKPLIKRYPIPGKNPAPERIEDVRDQIDRVRIPMGERYAKAPPPLVQVGDRVEEGDLLGEPLPNALSVGVHASIPGVVTAVTEQYVDIERAR